MWRFHTLSMLPPVATLRLRIGCLHLALLECSGDRMGDCSLI